MRVLNGPNRSVASTFSNITQMLLLLREKTELSEVGASAKISENDLFRLKVLIVADWKLAVADFRRLIILLSSITVVNLVWLLNSSFTSSGALGDVGELRLLALVQ